MTSIFKYIALILCILSIGFIGFLLYETQDEINATKDNIEYKIQKFYNEKKLGGFAVSVFSQDSIIYMGGFGYADMEEKKPYTISTQQYVASISKTTIGVSLLKAEELGLINLDESIDSYLPFSIRNPSYPNHEITLRHLATHSSSLDYNEKVVESLYMKEDEKLESLQSFIEAYFSQNEYGSVKYTEHRPGENYNYSNLGAGLAAYIIEIQSGMSYADFVKKHIFQPLGLYHSFWFHRKADSMKHTKYYEPTKGNLEEVKTSGIQLYPCRDLIMDIGDLTSYCQALIQQSPKILTKASFEEMFNGQLKNSVENQSDDNSGIFFQIDRNQYGITYQLIGGSGGDNCINTMMFFDPVLKLGYIFIGNTGGSKENRSNHILIYRALVSLGNHYVLENPEKAQIGNFKFRAYNYYNRVSAFF